MDQHVGDALPGEELVRVFRLAEAVEEDRQVVMEVEALYWVLYLPSMRNTGIGYVK